MRRERAGENRMPNLDEFSSYKSRSDQRTTASVGAAVVKDYRASSFQLNIIHEEEQQPNPKPV